MSLSIGIVGLPNVGKSTLFNALTKDNVLAANYPFATIEPNVGVVGVPDERLAKLAQLFSSEKELPAALSFVDIAGIVKGASEGAGLGNKFLANIRETDAILHVVRCFEEDNIVHVKGQINPADDIETINTELALADLETVEKAIQKITKNSPIFGNDGCSCKIFMKIKFYQYTFKYGRPCFASLAVRIHRNEFCFK